MSASSQACALTPKHTTVRLSTQPRSSWLAQADGHVHAAPTRSCVHKLVGSRGGAFFAAVDEPVRIGTGDSGTGGVCVWWVARVMHPRVGTVRARMQAGIGVHLECCCATLGPLQSAVCSLQW